MQKYLNNPTTTKKNKKVNPSRKSKPGAKHVINQPTSHPTNKQTNIESVWFTTVNSKVL